ncbi:MAG TPA: hypothetical protein VN516_10240, partial [Candidatus Baltobacteraceae bacterium]|nr:hypothetical protein [Candidatus Baltobacteraceae bacterium]
MKAVFPSPQPSPAGRGRIEFSLLANWMAAFVRHRFESFKNVICCSFSLWEKVRMRGIAATILFLAVAATAQANNSSNSVPFLGNIPQFHLTTNKLSDAEIQGRNLAKQLANARPIGNFTNTGILQIRDNQGKSVTIPVQFEVFAHDSSWEANYRTEIVGTNSDINFSRTYFSWSTIIHSDGQPNIYRIPNVSRPPTDTNEFIYLNPNQIMTSFARSDFWDSDLGLEFFHWPEQKIIKKEFSRGRGCMVLESTNP